MNWIEQIRIKINDNKIKQKDEWVMELNSN